MYRKSINYEKCNSCMKCESICANSRVIEKNSDGKPEFKNDIKCIYCGHCLAICPQTAITFDLWDSKKQLVNEYYAKPHKLDPKRKLPDEDEMFEFLLSIRSNRYFLNIDIEKEKILKLLDIMTRAPSAGNEQNRNFYILDDKTKVDKLENLVKNHYDKMRVTNPLLVRLLAMSIAKTTSEEYTKNKSISELSLKERYKNYLNVMKNFSQNHNEYFSYLRNAHAVIIITSNVKGSIMHKSFYKGDSCIAVTYGIMAAKAIGLDSCWLGLCEIAMNQNKSILKAMNIKDGERVDGVLALGYSDIKWEQAPPRGPVKTVWL